MALAKAKPGKLNIAAAAGISILCCSVLIKNVDLPVVKVPYRDIMQAPNDLSEEPHPGAGPRSRWLVDAGGQDQGSGREQHATRADRAGYPDGKGGGYPALSFESIGGIFGRAACRNATREAIAADVRAVAADPAIAKRLGDIGTIMDIRGPAEFGRAVDEQRDRIAGIAKVSGIEGGAMSVRYAAGRCRGYLEGYQSPLLSAEDFGKVRDIYDQGDKLILIMTDLLFLVSI